MKRVLAGAAATIVLLAVSSLQAQEGQDSIAAMPVALANDKAAPDTNPVIEQASAPATDQAEQRGSNAVPDAAPAAAKRAPPPPPPAATLVLKTDLAAQRLTVLEGGQVRHVWPISSGRRDHATPTGTFRPAWMAKMWRSRQYDDAPMPHSVFFNGGIAFHATSAVSMLGRPASHGCIRLAPANAARLYAPVRRHGLVHTKVVVHGAPNFREPPVIARRGPVAPKTEVALVRQRGNVRVSRYGAPLVQTQWFFAQ